MELTKAIEISQHINNAQTSSKTSDSITAITLGIEAMKAHLKARTPPFPLIDFYLPGETPPENEK